MAIILLMGVSGGDWLPILFILIGGVALYSGLEWVVNYTEHFLRRKNDAHTRH